LLYIFSLLIVEIIIPLYLKPETSGFFSKRCFMFRIFLLFTLGLRIALPVFSQVNDIDLLLKINHHRPVGLDGTCRFVSSTVTPLSIACPVTLLVVGKLSGDKPMFQNGIKSGIAITATVSVYTLLKYVINRKRPYDAYPDIDKLANESTPSFPSGHTASAFCTATSLSLMYPKWYVIIPAYSWASLVAYSRMHLGMHYPTDVIVGVLLGVSASLLTFKVQQLAEKK
jgi:membrane-associated phospholipid phosphatase